MLLYYLTILIFIVFAIILSHFYNWLVSDIFVIPSFTVIILNVSCYGCNVVLLHASSYCSLYDIDIYNNLAMSLGDVEVNIDYFIDVSSKIYSSFFNKVDINYICQPD